MNLRQLEILRAVIRCETTVAASRELGLSQPAVSNAIKHMETQLGFPLFERLNNRLFATADARALYDDSDAIFVLHKALVSKVRDLREHRAEKLRIVSTPPLGHGVIPLALRRFLERRTRVRVSFDIRRLETVAANVENDSADLGFGLGLPEHPTLHTEPFFERPMVCVMRPDHPLARRATITPADLATGPFIALEHGSRLGDAVRNAFAQAGEPFGFAVEVRYCNTACVLAEGGVGAAVVDPLSALAGSRHDLAVRPFEPAISVSACVMHAKSRPLSRLAKAFLGEVRSAAQEVGAQLG